MPINPAPSSIMTHLPNPETPQDLKLILPNPDFAPNTCLPCLASSPWKYSRVGAPDTEMISNLAECLQKMHENSSLTDRPASYSEANMPQQKLTDSPPQTDRMCHHKR
jgi:hypothetical protein